MKKIFKSADYNYAFDTNTGMFARWGETLADDPQFSPVGPELLDIEISTICHKGCKFCYKSNTAKGETMSLETFKKVFENVKGNVLQIAFGIGDVYPEMYPIFAYCRSQGIVPNVTINGNNLTSSDFTQLAYFCGAVAVSNYNKNNCYGAIEQLNKYGLKQVNIHQLLSEETFFQCLDLIDDIESKDPRLEGLNAVVFLSLKRKGRGIGYHPVSRSGFDWMVKKLAEKKISFGFDSCTAHKFLKFIDEHPEYGFDKQVVEPCESGLFSLYINVEGKAFPCSFTETGDGIDLTRPLDFLKDVWYSESMITWRTRLLQCSRNCPVYKI